MRRAQHTHPHIMQPMKSIQRALLASSLLGCISAQAGTELSSGTGTEEPAAASGTATGLLLGKLTGETAWDRAWSAFTLYKDDNNPILQEFSLQGRLQVQYADGHAGGHFDIEDFKRGSAANEQTVWGDQFEARRARFGFKSKWYQNWKFEGQIDVDTTSGVDDLYRDIYDLYVTYAPSDTLNVSVGKTKVKFGREQEISSKEILTFERTLVSNLLFPGELTGAWVNGKGIREHWLYELGVYGSDRVREFSSFDQGAVILGKIGYDYSSQASLDSAVASFHYMHNSEPGYRESNSNNFFASGSPSFTDSIALTNDITHGRFGLTTELLYGFGFEGTAEVAGKNTAVNQTDVFGLTIIPSYFIADGLQLVGRFQWATSGDVEPKNGSTPATTNLAVPGRYERWAPSVIPNGDSYTSFYLGLNYYLYGHKLKIMNGIEYSMMDGGLPGKNQTASYDGYTFLSGLRFSF
jgi:phosphate-selective porin OprO/OprP